VKFLIGLVLLSGLVLFGCLGQANSGTAATTPTATPAPVIGAASATPGAVLQNDVSAGIDAVINDSTSAQEVDSSLADSDLNVTESDAGA